MATVKELFEEEVKARIEGKAEDDNYMAENPDADLRRDALEDMKAMGPDYGGTFEEGVSPTYLDRDGNVDKAAMQRQAAYLADMRRQRSEWVKIRQMAMRELRTANVMEESK